MGRIIIVSSQYKQKMSGNIATDSLYRIANYVQPVTRMSAHKHLFKGRLRVSRLKQLRQAQTLHDLATLLDYEAKGLSYIIYKIEPEYKYRSFRIAKKSGGVREILAPTDKLKKLQKSLAKLLSDCLEEIDGKGEAPQSLSHGFKRGHTIATNADRHKKKRFVFNVDLADFFPSINFGRVRGFFIKNHHFKLAPKVATLIAQISCHNNALPQGSPCSPIISNLIAHIMDVHLVKLSKKYNCTYSRYADDLTFSTNQKNFPRAIAYKKILSNGRWMPGKKLIENIQHAGFSLNTKKTRMQCQNSRQLVTGITVNRHVNTKSEFYRYARSMCDSLFNKGQYTIPNFAKSYLRKSWLKQIAFKIMSLFNLSSYTATVSLAVDLEEKEGLTSDLNRIHGILDFIYQTKRYRFRKRGIPEEIRNKKIEHIPEIKGIKKLYRDFLFFKFFYALNKPIIFCEGITDSTYLKCALRRLASKHPVLAFENKGKIQLNISFLNKTEHTMEVLDLAPGIGGIKYFVKEYHRSIQRYKCAGKLQPVIVLVDNDTEAKGLFSEIKTLTRAKEDISGDADFYHIVDNLYVIAIPKIENKETIIEDYFDSETKALEIGGKKLSTSNGKLDGLDAYSKAWFAEKVVAANQKTIDFSSFDPIFIRINRAIAHYTTRLPMVLPKTSEK